MLPEQALQGVEATGKRDQRKPKGYHWSPLVSFFGGVFPAERTMLTKATAAGRSPHGPVHARKSQYQPILAIDQFDANL